VRINATIVQMYNKMKKIIIGGLLVFSAMFSFAQNQNGETETPKAPKNTVKIPGYEIYVKGTDEYDRMDWVLANRSCECKGEGWRLPSIGELQIIYEYKDMFNNFSKEYYWAIDQNPYTGKYYNLTFRNGHVAEEYVEEHNKVRCIWSPRKPQ